jgi:LacI family transcriptional regulator
VASDAGVSVTTVSHALSGKRAVSETTRARILRSVERLSYQPNVVASSLRRSTTQTVGLLIADLTNPYYPAVARAVQDVLERDGYLTFIGNTDGERSSEIRWLRAMLARSVDGVIMQPLTLSAGEIRDIVGDVALVVAREDDGEATADRVWTDDARGITEAVRHLVDRGVTEIGFLSGPSDVGPGPGRLAGWRRAVQDAGLEPPDAWVLEAPYTRDGGLHAGQQLLALPTRPRALMCANDLMAIGVMDAARAAGLRIPADLAVVGFDDIETADLVSPRLTTIHNPAAELGAACASALLGRLADGPGAAPARVVLPTRLVVRESA